MFAKVLLVLPFLCLSAVANAGEVSIHKNETTGLLTWTAKDDGFTLELIQLIPDFIRAIYAKHNFPAEEVERAASYCMFGTILKNTSQKKMRYRVKDWRYIPKGKSDQSGKTLPVKTKTQWLEEWRKAGILFSWTLLPDSGDFSVGDWQQGFTTIQLPRESKFDLFYTWEIDGVAHKSAIYNLQCAPESLPNYN